jgi:hypothetical protein
VDTLYFSGYPFEPDLCRCGDGLKRGALDQLGADISLESERIGLGWSQAWMRPTQLIQRLDADFELHRVYTVVDSNLYIGGVVNPVSASGYESRAETNISLHGEYGIALNVGSSVRIDNATRAYAKHWNLS